MVHYSLAKQTGYPLARIPHPGFRLFRFFDLSPRNIVDRRIATMLLLFIAILPIPHQAEGFSESCPVEQTIDINHNGIVHCEVGYDKGSYYWYLGSTSETKPILVLEDGEKNGTKYKDGHYDITSKGYMKIINAQMEHKGIYTFVVTSSNETLIRRDITVEITEITGQYVTYISEDSLIENSTLSNISTPVDVPDATNDFVSDYLIWIIIFSVVLAFGVTISFAAVVVCCINKCCNRKGRGTHYVSFKRRSKNLWTTDSEDSKKRYPDLPFWGKTKFEYKD